MYRNASLVTVTTAARKPATLGALRGHDDVNTVYNGFPRRLRERPVARSERFTVAFHGVLGFFQDIDTLATVIRRLSEEQVDTVVVGYGRKEGIMQDLTASGFTFYGQLDFESTIDVVARAHVGLSLRTADRISHEAFPVKVFEYLGLGIPVISTPPNEGGEFLESTGSGRQFTSGDVDGIVQEILRLRDDAPYYRSRCDAAEEAARKLSREDQSVRFASLCAPLLTGAA